MELKDNSVELTEEGITLAEMALETNDLWDENDPWARQVSVFLLVPLFFGFNRFIYHGSGKFINLPTVLK